MKDAKSLFSLALALFLLASCNINSSSSSPSSSGGNPSVYLREVKDVEIYVPTEEGKKLDGALSCGFSSLYENEEAYFSLDDVLVLVAEKLGLEKLFSKEEEGDIFLYRGGNELEVSFSVDTSNNSITFPDYPSYIALGSGHEGDFSWGANIKRLSITKEEYVNGGEMIFDLDQYDIDIVKEDGDVYLPSAVTRYIFLDVHNISLIYNGEAIYRPSSHDDIYLGGLTPFGEEYYSSPYNDLEMKDEDVASLHGNESMFYLDHFYGFLDDEKYGGGKVSDYLKEHYPEQYSLFFSRKKDEGERVYEWLLHAYFDDLHSTAPANMGSLYEGNEFTNEYGDTPRYLAYLERYLTLYTLREENLGIGDLLSSDDMLSFVGDMAVIRFDVFNRNEEVLTIGDASYYEEHINEDLYSLFAYSFMKIEEKGNVKKVVLDISLNGGGYTEACLEALSFLKEEIISPLYYASSGSLSSLSYKGILPNERASSYEKDYDFYILTSLCTFSSANLMATLGKNAGIKTVGEASGGGACMVGFFYTPEGQACRISSPIRFCLTDDKEHNDSGIAPDIALDSSYFYDLEKLSAKLDEVDGK